MIAKWFFLEGELVKLFTSDGLELAGFYCEGGKGSLAVLHIHGTGGDFYTHGFVEQLAQACTERGASFLSANTRGHDVFPDIRKRDAGGKVEWVTVGSAYERFFDSPKDIGACLDFLAARGKKRTVLLGYSYGANKAVNYAANFPDGRVVGVVILSGANDAGLMKDVLGPEKFEKADAEVAKKIADGKGSEIVPDELAVICKMSYATYSDYLADGGEGDIFRYHDLDAKSWGALGAVKVPVLAVYGSKDKYMKPSAKDAAAAVKGKASNSKSVETFVIEGAGHSFLGKEAELSGIVSEWASKIAREG